MERKSWPWKRKSSPAASSHADQDDAKVLRLVQVTPEAYAEFIRLEERTKVLQEQLSTAQSEMVTKESLVKQHAKVAEEAISGWEKAEAEAAELKNQLETVTLVKVSAEERAAHLDGALKECMKQVRDVKEEGETKLRDVAAATTNLLEKLKAEHEAQVAAFERELMAVSDEKDALVSSLEEHMALLTNLGEEKSRADAEIEVMKSSIAAGEREINSLKYEVHVLAKELEIRTEEKDMSLRSADVANKQHQDGAKKIAKLEAECQRLRGLVRKKLPGPAALAQMRQEVGSFGRPQAIEFAMQSVQRENEFLAVRLVATEDENRMLKEALAKCNGELLASRSLCGRTASKLRRMEAQMLPSSPSPRSLGSAPDFGADDERSCAESWAPPVAKERGAAASAGAPLELMDDFLEMEQLARSSVSGDHATPETDGSAVAKLRQRIVVLFDALSPQDGVTKAVAGIRRIISGHDGGDDNAAAISSVDSIVAVAVSRIHEFFASLRRDALRDKMDQFTAAVERAKENPTKQLPDMIVALGNLIAEAGELGFRLSGDKWSESNAGSPDCVDKVALLENETVKKDDSESSGDTEYSGTTREVHLLSSEKRNLESKMEELASRLADSQRRNGLLETQLRCMAESYEMLETRKRELEEEVESIRARMRDLEAELAGERHARQQDHVRLRALQSQFESMENDKGVAEESSTKTKQEREIAAAAEKLAACQETILTLSRQFHTLRAAPPKSGDEAAARIDASVDSYDPDEFPKSPLTAAAARDHRMNVPTVPAAEDKQNRSLGRHFSK